MAGQKYIENQTYNKGQMLGDVAKAGFSFGKSLGPRSKRMQPQQKYGGLMQNVKAASNGQQMPFPGTTTVPYGGQTKFEKFHPGVDVSAGMGSPIQAPMGGTVKQVVSGKKQGDPGYGNFVIVEDERGMKHRFSHLRDSFVKINEAIGPGQQIGTEGNTGSTYSLHGNSGAHLDFRIWDSFNKRYVNPLKYLTQYGG